MSGAAHYRDRRFGWWAIWHIILLNGLLLMVGLVPNERRALSAEDQPPKGESPTATRLNLHKMAADLVVPPVVDGAPAPGRRVKITTQGWAGTAVYHLIYLPSDWKPDVKLPVLIEYAGNGNYRNDFGDISNGTVEGASLGYGLSGGTGFIWISLPFVEVNDGKKRNAVTWWGDIAETKRYGMATVAEVCARYNGDPQRVVLCGFSRGALACNYIGLHDDEIAKLWRAFFCHSHYDGINERWPYPEADRQSALKRLARLAGRPQWISHEGSVGAVKDYLAANAPAGRFTFGVLPYPNHTDVWVLRDLDVRTQARKWLQLAISEQK
jgi:hypothetical protein